MSPPPSPMVQPRIQIGGMLPGHWPEVARIFQEGMETGLASLETELPAWEDWNVHHLPHCRLVARIEGHVAGWAALSPVSHRKAYRGVAEVSVYVGKNHRGIGVGLSLLNQLIECSEENGIWTLQAVVFEENLPSLRLHQKCGFRLVGRRERIAFYRGRWINTLLLERRSPNVH